MLGGKKLGHCGFAGHAGRSRVLGPCGAIDEQGAGIDIKRHVGDVTLHHLEIGKRCAHDMATAHPVGGLVQCPPRET